MKPFEELSLSEIMSLGTHGTTKPGGIGVRKTKACEEKLKRIQNLPKMVEGRIFKPFTKVMALKYIKNFHDGIKNNSFGLKKLKNGTIARKIKEGYPNPDTPLYAAGDENKERSYMNMMRLHTLKKGYSVRPSTRKHWKAKKMKLSDLFKVHEGGTIIKGVGGALIRIPARPAAMKAFKKTMQEQKKMEINKWVKRAITKNINDAQAIATAIEIARLEKGLKQFDRQD